MGVKHLSYTDIPKDQRQKGAAEARARIVAMMANPFLTPEQRAHFEAERRKIDQWEAGTLPVVRTPVAHTVNVGDGASVGEKVG